MKQWLLATCLLSVVGCRHAETSIIKHDEGRFTNDSVFGDFIEVTDDQVANVFDSSSFLYGKTAFLQDDDAMVKRLQGWADEMRLIMIQSDPRVKNIPRPLIRIRVTDVVNANAKAMYVRVDSKIFGQSAVGDKEGYLEERPEGFVKIWKLYADDINHLGTLEEKARFVESAMKYHPECTLRVIDDQIELGDKCPSLPAEPAKGFLVLATANRFYVNSGLIERLTEEQTVGVMAHELAHYYMGHATPKGELYGYFYDEKEIGAQKPKPLPYEDPRSVIGRAILDGQNVTIEHYEGEKFSRDTTIMSTSFVEANPDFLAHCRGAAACLKACEAVVKFVLDKDKLMKIWNPFSDEAEYHSYQNQFLECASNLSAKDLSQSYLDTVRNNSKFAFQAKIDPEGKTFAEFLLALDVAFEQQKKIVVDAYQDARLKFAAAPFGYYTYEQEADEVAVQVMLKLGLKARDLQSFFIGSLDRRSKGQGNICKEDWDKGFPEPLTIQSFDDQHHDPCYRIYNIERELRLHAARYAEIRANTSERHLSSEDWNKAVASLKERTAALKAKNPTNKSLGHQ